MPQLWEEVLTSLAGTLAAGPGLVFLAGGAVRDILLGEAPRDIDLLIETEAESEPAILGALSDLSGMEPVLFDRRPPSTHRLVVAGVVVDISFCAPGGLNTALARRDFTINSMAIPIADLSREPRRPTGVSTSMTNASNETLIDPLGGLADLRGSRIRAASATALDDDPLRMLRAVRLAAALPGFTIDPGLADSIKAASSRISESASERVQSEFEIIFRMAHGGAALRSMDALGLLAPLLPELEPLRGLRQPARHHDHDAFDHTLHAVEEADRLALGCEELSLVGLSAEDRVVLKWAALLHDAGKAAAVTVDDGGTPHFYGHETISASLAEDALRRLRVPSRIVEPVVKLIDLHLRLGALASAEAGDRPIRRLVRAAGDLLHLLVLLSIADRRAAGGERAAEREATLIDVARRALAQRADVEAIAKAPPLLDGREIMEILGIAPGPRVGSIARWLERLRTDGRITTREEAADLLRGLPPSRVRD